MRGVRGIRKALLLPVALLALVACTNEANENPTGQPQFTGAYASELEQAYNEASNDYQRAMLADGAISQAEMLDAQSRAVECIQASGLGMITDPYEIYGWFGIGYGSNMGDDISDAQWDAIDACMNQWFDADGNDLRVLYQKMYTNPNQENMSDLIARCLVRHGLAPAGFLGDDYDRLEREWMDKYASRYSIPEGWEEKVGSGRVFVDPNNSPFECSGWCRAETPPPMLLPGGASMNDPQAVTCQMMPLS
ncbi:MAG: hypothetical protein LBC29_06610 [Propionibacteriaceae bacterium]|jgi:hypothetical protein|nr:hypothetical protein [Propionibacteriaceae bacterium]